MRLASLPVLTAKPRGRACGGGSGGANGAMIQAFHGNAGRKARKIFEKIAGAGMYRDPTEQVEAIHEKSDLIWSTR